MRLLATTITVRRPSRWPVAESSLLRMHVTFQPVRLQAGFFPDSMNCILADVQCRSESAATPVGRAVLWLLAGRRENPGTQLRGQHRSCLSRVIRIEAVDSGGEKALLPPVDGRCRRPQPLLDGTEASALGQQQDEPGAEYVSSRQRAGLGNPAEFELLVAAEHNVTAGHAQLDVFGTSNVYS